MFVLKKLKLNAMELRFCAKVKYIEINTRYTFGYDNSSEFGLTLTLFSNVKNLLSLTTMVPFVRVATEKQFYSLV